MAWQECWESRKGKKRERAWKVKVCFVQSWNRLWAWDYCFNRLWSPSVYRVYTYIMYKPWNLNLQHIYIYVCLVFFTFSRSIPFYKALSCFVQLASDPRAWAEAALFCLLKATAGSLSTFRVNEDPKNRLVLSGNKTKHMGWGVMNDQQSCPSESCLDIINHDKGLPNILDLLS